MNRTGTGGRKHQKRALESIAQGAIQIVAGIYRARVFGAAHGQAVLDDPAQRRIDAFEFGRTAAVAEPARHGSRPERPPRRERVRVERPRGLHHVYTRSVQLREGRFADAQDLGMYVRETQAGGPEHVCRKASLLECRAPGEVVVREAEDIARRITADRIEGDHGVAERSRAIGPRTANVPSSVPSHPQAGPAPESP